MKTIDEKTSVLLLIDFQARLMSAIHDGEVVLANATRLRDAARALNVPILITEQNPKGLGSTVAPLADAAQTTIEKMSFDATADDKLLPLLKDYAQIIVAGCEAHVCVLQTVLGLLDRHVVFVVRDAIGSRRAENKETAITRLEKHRAEIVTTEMVIFEWLSTAEHPQFRDIVALIK